MDDQCARQIELLGHADLRTRKRAVKSLEQKRQLPCLLSALDNPSVPELTKRLICEILYRRRWTEAVPVLIHQLHADDPGVRAAAADALGAIGDARSGPMLLELLEDLTQPVYVRDTAAFSLGLVRYRAAWPSLTRFLRDPAETVRYSSAKALMFLEEPSAIPAVEAAIKREQSSWVREQLSETLRKLSLAQSSSIEDS